jgi:7,8-dihydro-6-hydroxymethylpterin-pyrophosphokinase
VLQSDELTIPHPHWAEREFVTIPLAELETGVIGCSEHVRPLYMNWYIREGL